MQKNTPEKLLAIPCAAVCQDSTKTPSSSFKTYPMLFTQTLKKFSAAGSFLVAMLFMVSCSKDIAKRKVDSATTDLGGLTTNTLAPATTSPATTSTAPTTTSTSTGTALLYSASNTYDRADGTYFITQASQDYKSPVNGWSDARMNINSGRMKTTLTRNVVGPDGGLVSWIDVPDASEYQLSFDMMFDSQFDFSAGGKVGFGFLIGEGYTGGQPASNGDGGSARIMWYKQNGRVYLKPYVYYKDQPGTYGDDFGITYPSSGNIQTGTWYTVQMYFKANTGSNTDGRIRMVINGTTIIDRAIRWTTNDLKRLVNRVTFETFRGGADASWTSTTDGNIYFDNVNWGVIKY